MTEFKTTLIYIFIFLFSTFAAFWSQKNNDLTVHSQSGHAKLLIVHPKTNRLFFLLSFVIPWIFLAFTNIGVDYINYYKIVDILTWNTIFKYYDLEGGFNIVLLLLKTIFNSNIDLVIFFIKTLTILLFYFCFYQLKNYLRIGYCVFSYLMMIYFPSFFLLSQCFASAIVFLAITIFIVRKKVLFPIIILAIATQMHNATYLVIPCFFIIFLMVKLPRKSTLLLLITIAVYCLAFLLADKIYLFAQNNVRGFHYNNYGDNNWSGSGLFVFVVYIPLLFFVFYVSKNDPPQKTRNILIVLVATSFLFKALSYVFVVIERVEFFLFFIYSIIIPFELYKGYGSNKTIDLKQVRLTDIFFFFYLAFRGFLIYREYVLPRTGLNSYHFFNPFI